MGHAHPCSPASQVANLCSSKRWYHHTEGENHPFAMWVVISQKIQKGGRNWQEETALGKCMESIASEENE